MPVGRTGGRPQEPIAHHGYTMLIGERYRWDFNLRFQHYACGHSPSLAFPEVGCRMP